MEDGGGVTGSGEVHGGRKRSEEWKGTFVELWSKENLGGREKGVWMDVSS